MADTDTLPTLTDEQKKELGLIPSVNGSAYAAPRTAGIPSVNQAPQVAAPAPTAPAAPAQGAIPSLAPPTKQQSQAAGKSEYAAGLPTVTAAPLTPEYYQQQRALSDFKAAHPLGSDISAKPGVLGKVEHGLAKVGNIAGDALVPNVMAAIPGTDLNNDIQRGGQAKGFTAAVGNEEKEAQEKNLGAETEKAEAETAATEQGNQPVEWTPPNATAGTVPIMVPAKAVPTLDEAAIRGGATSAAAETKNAPALAKLGLKYDNTGNVIPMEDSELSPEIKQQRAFQSAATDLKKAQTALANSKNDPNSAAYKLEKAKVDEANERTQQAAQALGLHQEELTNKIQEQQLVKPSGQTVSRGDAAGAALQLLPGLQEAVRKNAGSLGPLVGRIAKGELKLGNVDPEVQKFYAQLESFYSLQPAIHGFRNAEFVKDFNTFVGNLSTNPDAIIAGLEGLKPTLETVEKSGRTFKQRIVEPPGGATAPPAGGAAVKTYNPATGKLE